MRKVLSSIVCVSIIIGLWAPTVIAAEKQVKLAENATSAIVIERDTGEIIFEKNKDEKLPPASMTKIMTMLLIMEALEREAITYDDMVRTSEYAASMGGSQIFLEPGEEMTVRDMLKAIAVASGNDASVAMAEHIAGTEEEFVEMMNNKAKNLGLEHTRFVNVNGLPADEHYSSAHDLAIMSKELLKYEDITNFTGIYEDYLRQDSEDPFWLVNTNKLVKFYPGVDGLKTGFTQEAKYCLAATAEKKGMRIITVVMGAPSPKERNAQITSMLDYAFSQYETHQLYDRGYVMADVNVSKGDKKQVAAMTAESVSLLTKKGIKIDDVVERIQLNDDLRAPIEKGAVIGTLYIEKEGQLLNETKLLAESDVQEASWWTIFKRTIGKFAVSS
ncbi:D-alanyl-D-alanine carboxypeptidase family protein [Halalkalibacter sp. APA_J-10(15)]|uniref:D-alanyl-D-alanine carboxypeptidase family protein n=1 Tax=unclassified Halalkalibacter TaxID=2893063 RepID=UPI001FF68CDD|nr:D-alanyl-D-alanine carboxypeptidase family protein [Halalkalibacter sp. APA_J-10(15)]MCK0473170.1 D-alanyl-D-alanine carboxypeptidase [Halalkalibacter sp. APA_J-10(15)]